MTWLNDRRMNGTESEEKGGKKKQELNILETVKNREANIWKKESTTMRREKIDENKNSGEESMT